MEGGARRPDEHRRSAGSEGEACRAECAPIFQGLDQSALEEVHKMCRTLTYERGQVVFQEGEPAFGLYIICQGKVKLAKRSPRGKEQILKLVGPGELLGEKTMFDRETYTAYAKTLERTTFHFFERGSLLEFLQRHPVVALRVIEKLSRELKAFQDRLMETSYESSSERLARLLLLMAKQFGVSAERGLYVGVELTREELAEMAGIATETAIRTLSRFKERGFIDLEGHRIYIRDREGLSQLAEPFQVNLRETLI